MKLLNSNGSTRLWWCRLFLLLSARPFTEEIITHCGTNTSWTCCISGEKRHQVWLISSEAAPPPCPSKNGWFWPAGWSFRWSYGLISFSFISIWIQRPKSCYSNSREAANFLTLLFFLKFHEGHQDKQTRLKSAAGRPPLCSPHGRRLIGKSSYERFGNIPPIIIFIRASAGVWRKGWMISFTYYSLLREKKVQEYPICAALQAFIYLDLSSLWIALPCGNFTFKGKIANIASIYIFIHISQFSCRFI